MKVPVITAFIWDNYSRILADAGRRLGLDIRTFSRVMLSDGTDISGIIEESMKTSDVVLIHLMGASAPEPIGSILERLPESTKTSVSSKALSIFRPEIRFSSHS